MNASLSPGSSNLGEVLWGSVKCRDPLGRMDPTVAHSANPPCAQGSLRNEGVGGRVTGSVPFPKAFARCATACHPLVIAGEGPVQRAIYVHYRTPVWRLLRRYPHFAERVQAIAGYLRHHGFDVGRVFYGCPEAMVYKVRRVELVVAVLHEFGVNAQRAVKSHPKVLSCSAWRLRQKLAYLQVSPPSQTRIRTKKNGRRSPPPPRVQPPPLLRPPPLPLFQCTWKPELGGLDNLLG